jgi:hypothetical protein
MLLPIPPTPNPGVQNQAPEGFIRQFLNPALQGDAWTAIVAALGSGDATNWDNAEYAFDQLFISSASEQFLDRQLADNGINRPEGIGLSDPDFRQLGIDIKSNQLTQPAILKVLQVFYGTDAVCAYEETAAGAPFALQDGWDLQLLFDGVNAVPVTFSAADFTNISAATAIEVAVAITRAIQVLGNNGFAIAWTDPLSSLSTVRVYSGTIGLRSSVQVTGGRAQNALLFEEQLPLPLPATVPSTLVWNVYTHSPLAPPSATNPPTNIMRLALVSGALSLLSVHPGDYVNVFGAAFQPQNRGSFPILDVYVAYSGATLVQYVDVENFVSTPQSSVAEVTLDDVRFYRPLKATTQALGSRTVVVDQSVPDACQVIIPATSAIIKRGVDTAAYLHVAPPLVNPNAPGGAWPISRDDTGLVTVYAPGNTLTAGSQIFVDNIVPSLELPAVISGTMGTSGGNGTTDASPLSQFSEIRVADQVPEPVEFGTAALLPNSSAIVIDPPAFALQVGGDIDGVTTALCERFELLPPPVLEANGGYSWTYNYVVTASYPHTVERHAMAVITQGDNLGGAIVGGGLTLTGGPPTFYNDLNIYLPGMSGPGTWSTVTGTLSVARSSLSASVFAGNGDVVFAGGATSVNTAAVANVDITDGNQLTVTSGPSLLQGRAEHQGVSYVDAEGNSWVMAIGGRTLAQAAVNDNLVLALWHLDESTPTTAIDSGVNAYNLTPTGTTVDTAGEIGNARAFGAGIVLAGAGNALAVSTLLGPCTIEAWIGNIQAGPSGALQTILSYEGPAGSSATNILANLSAAWNGSTSVFTLALTWQDGTNATAATASATGTLDPTIKWHHVAVTKAQTPGSTTTYDVQFYLDGQPLGTLVSGLTNATGGGSSEWHIGESPQLGEQFYGSIDDVRVSGALPAPFQSPNPPTSTRSSTDIYLTWLRGRGNLLTEGSGQLLATTEALQQGASSWVSTGAMTWARSSHQATLLPDGRILVTGGYAYKLGQPFLPATALGVAPPTASAEIWDPRTGSWSPAGNMNFPRAGHQAVYLPASNQVLVFGGVADAAGDPAPQVFEYWNPATGLWTRGLVPMPDATYVYETAGTAVLMNDQDFVWVAGGALETIYGSSGFPFTFPFVFPGNSLSPGITTGLVFIGASDTVQGGGLEGWQTVTAVSGDYFYYETPAYPFYTVNAGLDTVITPFAAPPCGTIPGPYVYDTSGETPMGITSVQSHTMVPLYAGQQYATLTLSSSASAFPNAPGYLVLNFGSSEAAFAVPYLGVYGTDVLGLDYTYKMPFDVPAGSTVTLLAGKGPWVPPVPEAVGSFYLTDSNSGRIVAEGTVENISAGGLNVDIAITYPGDRGLGGEGLPVTGTKFSDKVLVWGSNNLNLDEQDARLGINLQVEGEGL